ncbi:MAG: hypothetical protein ABSE18_03280 [Minisyncoccia bacterium]
MKKILCIASVATGVAVVATAFIAAAQTTAPAAASALTTASEQPILQIGPAGKVLMRGTLASATSGALTVNSWGGVWTVNVGASAQVLPVAAGNDLAQFRTGDFVGVQGTVSQSANWTIDATLVRDWTYRQATVQEQKQNIQSAQTTIKSGTPRNYVGVASSLSGSSFTLTVNGVADTVNVASGAEVVNRNWITLPLASINSGDNVRVWGVNASGTITAQIVRDVSIPATSAQQ